jgi:hypothetical protein
MSPANATLYQLIVRRTKNSKELFAVNTFRKERELEAVAGAALEETIGYF